MDIQQKTTEVERELLELIIRHLKNNQLDAQTATKLARDFLEVLPIQNQEDLLTKMKSLSANYAEANAIYQQELGKTKRAREEEALLQMQGAIRQGNIEHAISVAKTLQNKT